MIRWWWCEVLEGRLRVARLEGRHFELEASVDGEKRTYVVIPAHDEVGRALAACVGMRVRVAGRHHEGPSIFMRGPVLLVSEVRPAGR